MNTAPTPKRHKVELPSRPVFDSLSISLKSEAHAIRLAQITTSFVHLEDRMALLLTVLMGTDDNTVAGYIMRSIKSPRGRFDLMKDLLEKAAINRERGAEYDEILREFWSINKARNDFVHGRWYTRGPDDVLLAKQDEHGLALFQAMPVDIKDMDSLLERIWALSQLLLLGKPAEELRERMLRKARAEQPHEPKPKRKSPTRNKAQSPTKPRPASGV